VSIRFRGGAWDSDTRLAQMPQEQDFPPIVENDDQAWTRDRTSLYTSHLALAETIEKFGDSRLEEIVPGRPYKFYRLFQSVIQHAVYHGGQIALLKRTCQKGGAADPRDEA